MRIAITAIFAIASLIGVSGCAVVSVGGSAVSVAGTVVATTAKAGATVVGGTVDLAIPDDDEEEG